MVEEEGVAARLARWRIVSSLASWAFVLDFLGMDLTRNDCAQRCSLWIPLFVPARPCTLYYVDIFSLLSRFNGVLSDARRKVMERGPWFLKFEPFVWIKPLAE